MLVNGAEGKWGGVKGQRKGRAPGGQAEGFLGLCRGKQREETEGIRGSDLGRGGRVRPGKESGNRR